MILIEPPLGVSAPIKLLELLWLVSAVSYDRLDENIMEDTRWDHLGKELWSRRQELSPYLTHSLNLPWPVPADYGEEGENPLVTASGILYGPRTMAACVLEKLKQGVPQEAARLRGLIEGHLSRAVR